MQGTIRPQTPPINNRRDARLDAKGPKPWIALVTQTYQVRVPYTEEITQTYTVCVPETTEVEETYTVMVPKTEERTGTRMVCVPETVTRHKTMCVDKGAWEERTCQVASPCCTKSRCGLLSRLGCGSSSCGNGCSTGCDTGCQTMTKRV